ncbi:alginate O-acetyltransferase AlgX-related protein [Deinococcus altitudinis]|uniref:alginate O-acetyltransferase AlgX-related protein n=1 Tax=Deinococcus altitudinis TaxID=468914 RepID=UPI0038919FE7
MTRLMITTFLLFFTALALADTDLTAVQMACLNNEAASGKYGGVYAGGQQSILFAQELETDWTNWKNLMPGVAILTKELADVGTKLLFTPVPTRVLVSPNLLNSDIKKEADFQLDYPQNQYKQLQSSGKAAGVNIVDLLSSIRSNKSGIGVDKNFFQYDIHWTPTGAQVAAQTIAQIYDRNSHKLMYFDAKIGQYKFPLLDQIFPLRQACNISGNSSIANMFATFQPDDLIITSSNLETLEMSDGKYWRWLVGPISNFYIYSRTARAADVQVRYISPVDNQSLKLVLNGNIVYLNPKVSKDTSIGAVVNLKLKKGSNTLSFNYGLWNRRFGKKVFSEDDRKLALRFDTLKFTAQKSGVTDFISEKPYPQMSSGDLLGDFTPPVVLAGSSYSVPELNFDGFLRTALGKDVLNESVYAGGAFTAMRDYLSSVNFQSGKPEVLIWEAPMVNPLGNNPADIRELQGMVNGPCIESKALVWKPGTIGPDATVNLPLVSDQVTYLYVKLNGATSQKIQVDELTGGNLTTRYTIDHGDRSQNRTQFWLRLPPGKATSFNISIPPQAGAPTTQADIAICKSL